mgnify:FL=1
MPIIIYISYVQCFIYKHLCYLEFNKEVVLKIALVVLIIIMLILLIFVANYSINIIRNSKIAKQYEEQIALLEKQKLEKQEAERQAKIPKLTEQGMQNIESIYHSDTKRAFLTFDDGPSSVTNTILDVLKQENVKATFFVLGSRVEAKPDVVKRIYDEGHYIANHGYSHVYENIYASPQAVLDEYNRCNDVVRNAIGVPEYNSHLFRFPGGLTGGKYADIKSQANELLKQNNIVHVDWNALNGDAETNDLSIDFELARLQETTQNKNSVVILMQDAPVKKVTAEALPQIISYLREQGYEFENFYDIIK